MQYCIVMPFAASAEAMLSMNAAWSASVKSAVARESSQSCS